MNKAERMKKITLLLEIAEKHNWEMTIEDAEILLEIMDELQNQYLSKLPDTF
jgi:predicted transcriptional regulator of viral defense system